MNGASARTLPELLQQTAARCGDATALIDGGNAVSFAGLDDQARRLANGLARLGVVHGDRVAVWLPNRTAWLTVLFALSRLGAIAVCVNTRFRAAEVEDILTRARVRALVYEPGFKGIDFDAILAETGPAALEHVQWTITAGPAATDGHGRVRLDDLFVAGDPGPVTASPGDGAVIFTTSGTTSKPKFVVQSQGSLSRHAEDVAGAFGYRAVGSVLLQALPLCGTFGLAQALAGIAAGCPSVLLTLFDGAEAARAVREHKVTAFNGSDEMFRRLLEAGAPGDLASLAGCGFACFVEPDPLELVEAADKAGLRLFGLYGMSEVQALYAHQPGDLPASERALGGGQLTSAEASARVCDPETGGMLPAGTSGELQLKGPSLFTLYFEDDPATQAAITDDGYMRTGDLGHLLPDGRFVFEARMGDSLRLGGFLVNPGEIDSWLERHDQVAASQTVGIEMDGRLRPVTFVIGAPGSPFEEAALIAHCRQGLAGFKVPARIFAVEGFPTADGPNGTKIQRGQLRAMARERL